MSVVYISKELQIYEPLTCAICRVKLWLDKATVGLFDANNRQAFACVSHFSEVELLIIGWADFIARERRKYSQQKQISSTQIYEGWQNARLNS
ncbi:MAG TPA: hypothetical protein VFM05_12480 [Candidatus Saccharimonadales bacterium]|nr:hypothetical protein [Candidatus Saccharimonadales bacterium]